MAFYSSTIFVQANFSHHAAELASVIFGLVNFLGAFPAIITMDTLGRRSLLLCTLPPMALSMLIAGWSFSSSFANVVSDPDTRFAVSAIMIYLFCLLYSPGMGPVPSSYAAEVYPLSHREIGASSASAVTCIFAALLSLTFPALLNAMGTAGAFELYAGLNIVAWLLVFLLMPETKQRSLEELDDVFSVSTRAFMRFHVLEYAPWWVRRYLLCRKRGNPAPEFEDLKSGVTRGRYAAIGSDED